MIRVSLLIATRNRCNRLRETLHQLDVSRFTRHEAELVLIDNASDDETWNVLERFQSETDMDVVIGRTGRVGKHVALNEGVALSSGDLLAFTDDDCLLGEGYLDGLTGAFDAGLYQYGGGEIVRADPSDDIRIASTEWLQDSGDRPILPNSIIPPGLIQGANMFFLRRVLECIGGFDEHLGLGTAFHCGDIDTACRASLAGFTGRFRSDLVVRHDHGRKTGSLEAEDVVRRYDYGRGAYYSKLIAGGRIDALATWMEAAGRHLLWSDGLQTLQRELQGAADYLAQHGNEPAKVGEGLSV